VIVRQSSGHFNRPGGICLGLYYPLFLRISQQKPGKVIFQEKRVFEDQPDLKRVATTSNILAGYKLGTDPFMTILAS
jgi:hypothetical protein